jgi:surface antigen
VGAIVVLQPWVQGAGGLGHVAVVERVLSNGHAISSNMNWGLRRWQVTYVEFAPGYGVSFVRA